MFAITYIVFLELMNSEGWSRENTIKSLNFKSEKTTCSPFSLLSLASVVIGISMNNKHMYGREKSRTINLFLWF